MFMGICYILLRSPEFAKRLTFVSDLELHIITVCMELQNANRKRGNKEYFTILLVVGRKRMHSM